MSCFLSGFCSYNRFFNSHSRLAHVTRREGIPRDPTAQPNRDCSETRQVASARLSSFCITFVVVVAGARRSSEDLRFGPAAAARPVNNDGALLRQHSVNKLLTLRPPDLLRLPLPLLLPPA